MWIPILIIAGIVIYERSKNKGMPSLPPAAPAVIDNIALTSNRTWTTVDPGSVPTQRFDGMFTGIRGLAPSPLAPVPQDWGNRAIYYGGYPTITGPNVPTYVGQIQNPVLRDYIPPTFLGPPTQLAPAIPTGEGSSALVNSTGTEQTTVSNSAGQTIVVSPSGSGHVLMDTVPALSRPIVPSAPVTAAQIANPFNPSPAVVGQTRPGLSPMYINAPDAPLVPLSRALIF